MGAYLQGNINPEFIVWLLQYFSPAAIVFIVVFWLTYKICLVVLDIIKELKKRDNDY